MEHAIWSVTAPAWQWIVTVVVALWLWESVVEHWFYRLKHWVLDKPHKQTKKKDM